jgi:hypothetical protein
MQVECRCLPGDVATESSSCLSRRNYVNDGAVVVCVVGASPFPGQLKEAMAWHGSPNVFAGSASPKTVGDCAIIAQASCRVRTSTGFRRLWRLDCSAAIFASKAGFDSQMAARYIATGKVIGVDLSEDMLDRGLFTTPDDPPAEVIGFVATGRCSTQIMKEPKQWTDLEKMSLVVSLQRPRSFANRLVAQRLVGPSRWGRFRRGFGDPQAKKALNCRAVHVD